MQWKVQTKDYQLDDSLERFINDKLDKLIKYLKGSALSGEIMLRKVQHSNKNRTHIAQLTLIVGDVFLRAEERAIRMETAFNSAFAKLERQIKKFKDKHQIDPSKTDQEHIIENIKKDTRAARSKRVRIKPMYFNDAVEQMELLDHDFYMFLNIDSNKINIVYRREDGGYGLLETEDA